MPDEIDRAQEFNEKILEVMIENSRFKPTSAISSSHCRGCCEPIPDKRRHTLCGVTTCIDCQDDIERQQR